MSLRIRRLMGVVALIGALLLTGVGVSLALAQPRILDGQVVTRPNGQMFLIQNGQRFLVTPIALSDQEIDSIPDGGVVSTLTGVNATTTSVFPPQAADPATAAELVLGQYWAQNLWGPAYALMHPDQQSVVTQREFSDTMRAFASAVRITNARSGSVAMVDNWTDPVTQKTYNGVARVSVNLTFLRGSDSAQIAYDLNLLKVGEYWRWFWAPPGG